MANKQQLEDYEIIYKMYQYNWKFHEILEKLQSNCADDLKELLQDFARNKVLDRVKPD